MYGVWKNILPVFLYGEILSNGLFLLEDRRNLKNEDENINYNHWTNGSRVGRLRKHDAEFKHGGESTEQQPGSCRQQQPKRCAEDEHEPLG